MKRNSKTSENKQTTGLLKFFKVFAAAPPNITTSEFCFSEHNIHIF
jgi:hypothetical protein